MDKPPALLDWLRSGQRDVYLFGTCLLDLFWPEAGEDTATLLERSGLRWHYPQGQSCCGQPAYTSGQRASARAVARAQLDLFPQPWPVIVPSGSCAGMISQHWPGLFEGEADEAQALGVAQRTIELGTFLNAWWWPVHGMPGAERPRGGEGAPRDQAMAAPSEAPSHQASPCRVALHTSCSARREVDMRRHGTQVLDQLPGVHRVEHPQEAECCGFGGVFSLKHPDISGAMVQDKLAHLVSVRPRCVVSADAGCLLNLKHAHEAQREQDPLGCLPMSFQHLASFLLTQLPPMPQAGDAPAGAEPPAHSDARLTAPPSP